MFNSKFKKMLKREFEEEYHYEGDYVKMAEKFEEEYGGVPKFNKKKYIRNVSFAFCFATLIITLLAVFISGRIINYKLIGTQVDINQYELTEEEVTYACQYCKGVREEPIYYVITANKSYISVYSCEEEGQVYYFVRIKEATENIETFFNQEKLLLSEGFYLLGITTIDSKGENLISFKVTEFVTKQEYVYDFKA